VIRRGMSNVLADENRQQVVGLGRLGWSLRRIEQATGVRRETASGYLKDAGVAVGVRRGRPEVLPRPATTTGVSTDSRPSRLVTRAEVSTDSEPPEVSAKRSRAASASACGAFRGEIEDALTLCRNGPRRGSRLPDGLRERA
jgi:hypothetical protein